MRPTRILPILALLWLTPLAAPAQIPDADAPITREQADAILRELAEIRRLLEQREDAPFRPREPRRLEHPKRGSPVDTEIDVQGRPTLGEPDAPVTVVEFVDYECPYCRRFFKTSYQRLKKDYIDPGKVRLVVVDLPMAFHKFARKAAQAARCAGDQGRYWQMHDLLFDGSAGLNGGALLAYAEQLELDMDGFRQCLEGERHLDRIDADVASAHSVGVAGTPSFIVGRSQGDRVKGPYIRGALPFRVFQRHIEPLLQPEDEPAEPAGG